MNNLIKAKWLLYKLLYQSIILADFATIIIMVILLVVIVIVITFYLSSFLIQETAKGPFGLRVNLPPAHPSTKNGGGFTLSL